MKKLTFNVLLVLSLFLVSTQVIFAQESVTFTEPVVSDQKSALADGIVINEDTGHFYLTNGTQVYQDGDKWYLIDGTLVTSDSSFDTIHSNESDNIPTLPSLSEAPAEPVKEPTLINQKIPALPEAPVEPIKAPTLSQQKVPALPEAPVEPIKAPALPEAPIEPVKAPTLSQQKVPALPGDLTRPSNSSKLTKIQLSKAFEKDTEERSSAIPNDEKAFADTYTNRKLLPKTGFGVKEVLFSSLTSILGILISFLAIGLLVNKRDKRKGR